jgi:hypothetical protein
MGKAWIKRVKAKLRAMVERFTRSIFSLPDDPQRSRLSRRFSNEISVYMGENGSIYVNHVSVTGAKDPAIAINMLWQAMQLFAMRSNVVLRLPSEAAAPAEVLMKGSMEIPPPTGRPVTEMASVGPEQNGHH